MQTNNRILGSHVFSYSYMIFYDIPTTSWGDLLYFSFHYVIVQISNILVISYPVLKNSFLH